MVRQVRAGLGCRSTSEEAQMTREEAEHGDRARPTPRATMALTHRIAVQQKDTMG